MIKSFALQFFIGALLKPAIVLSVISGIFQPEYITTNINTGGTWSQTLYPGRLYKGHNHHQHDYPTRLPLSSQHLAFLATYNMQKLSTYSPPSPSASLSSFEASRMSRSSTYSISGSAVAPMPSLMSHPPLQRIKPQTRLVYHGPYGVPQGLRQPPSSRRQSRTPSPSSSSGYSSGPSQPAQLQEFPCPYCHQVYKKVGYLNRHLLTHSGKRFRCEVRNCDKTFSRIDNMHAQ